MSHRPYSELQQEKASAGEIVLIGRKYIHHKYPERRYQVVDIGIQEASDKVCVIYCDTNMPDIHFVRDLDSWLERFTLAND